MERIASDGLYARYKRLIGYSVQVYTRSFPSIELDDMFQDGCVFMLEFFQGREPPTELTHNTFKKSLFYWMRDHVIQQFRKRTSINGRSLLRLDWHGEDDGKNPSGFVHLDDVLAAAETDVLVKLYAREFVAELRRVLRGDEVAILDMMLERMGTTSGRGEWVRAVAAVLNLSESAVYARIRHIREAALRTLSPAA